MTASPSQTENFGIAARYYAPPTFTSRDPHFERYFWHSPYTYCANNPMKYVDPTGCTIVITGENGLQYIWKDDKLYCKIGRANVEADPNRAGKYVGSVLETLNKINGTKEGKIVLGQLSSSKTQYTISNKQKGDKHACFSSLDNTLYLNGYTDAGIVAHELFHAYQHDNKRGTGSVYNEVEAYVFQGIISKSIGSDMSNTGALSRNGNKKYMNSMTNLMEHYSNEDFSYAVSHFRRDSKANASGKYKNYEYVPKGFGCGNSLLKKIR